MKEAVEEGRGRRYKEGGRMVEEGDFLFEEYFGGENFYRRRE